MLGGRGRGRGGPTEGRHFSAFHRVLATARVYSVEHKWGERRTGIFFFGGGGGGGGGRKDCACKTCRNFYMSSPLSLPTT